MSDQGFTDNPTYPEECEECGEGDAACLFCQIIARTDPTVILREWSDMVCFAPLNPVTEGHLLVVPRRHVTDALEVPWITGNAFMRAAQMGKKTPCNLITSVGAEATQTVRHLHVHVVPRREGDGLQLPWTGQIDSDES